MLYDGLAPRDWQGCQAQMKVLFLNVILLMFVKDVYWFGRLRLGWD
jgi:hypothetical protein